MSDYCQLARKALSHWLSFHQKLRPSPDKYPPAACFVSIHRPNGDLRGCMGTLEPTYKNVAEEIVQNAISAGTRDPRFSPVKPEELNHLRFDVSILRAPEIIPDMSFLDVNNYGVIVSHGSRRGVLLPGLEGIDSPEKQVEIAKRKAGIAPGEAIQLQRFEVEWHHEAR